MELNKIYQVDTYKLIKEGDIILDPFCGSASTLIAAKRLNRNFIGFELEEKWVQVGNDRLQGINQKGEMNLFDI